MYGAWKHFQGTAFARAWSLCLSQTLASQLRLVHSSHWTVLGRMSFGDAVTALRPGKELRKVVAEDGLLTVEP